MSLPRIAILDGACRPQYYAQAREQWEAEWVNLDETTDPADFSTFDLALVSDEFYSRTALQLLEAQRAGVPVLHVVDGVVEWRNTWENPRSLSPERGMPLFQPVLADKIACLGRSQARILESWGNLGRCEIVGAPRLDGLLGRTPRRRAADAPWTVLIMTARTPGFTPRQVANAARAVGDLRTWFASNPTIEGTRTRCLWRVTMQLDEELQLDPQDCCSAQPLADVLASVDAVVTTPSTAMIEAMLQGVPVALLDYNNCPHLTMAPWAITAPDHIHSTLSELFRPPASKLVWQQTLLHDQLECRSPATPRLIQLMQEMILASRRCKSEGTPLVLPRRMLVDPQAGHHLPEAHFELDRLYPAHRVFREKDVTALQAHIGHLQLQLAEERRRTEEARQTTDQIRKVFGVRPLLKAARKLPRLVGRPNGPKLY